MQRVQATPADQYQRSVVIVQPDYAASPGFSVYAIDPGETTGWAWCCVGKKELMADIDLHELLLQLEADTQGYMLNDTRFMSGQVKCYPGDESERRGAEAVYLQGVVCAHMAQRVSKGRVTWSIIELEDFIIRERTMDRSLLSPVRLTSMIELLFDRSTAIQCALATKYQASDAKSTFTDERMQRWGLWVPGQPHATDARRHLLLVLRALRDFLTGATYGK